MLSRSLIVSVIAAAVILIFNVGTAQAQPNTITSTPGKPIQDAAITTDTITVSQGMTVSDLNVAVNITHNHSGDLRLTLSHSASGISIPLMSSLSGGFAFGCGANAISAVFDDAAGASIDSFNCNDDFEKNVTGSWRPSASLAAFNGVSAAGTWTLTIQDAVETDTGTLNAWGLVFNGPAISDGNGGSTVATIINGGFNTPLCSVVDIDSDVMSATLPASISDAGVFCRIIAEDKEFLRTGAEVGVDSVINLGVIHAVDVYSTDDTNPVGTELCMVGGGGVIFLSENGIPRQPEWLGVESRGEFTCTRIPGEGTVVLVEEVDPIAPSTVISAEGAAQGGSPASDMASFPMDTVMLSDEGRPISLQTGTALENCQITTNYMLNIRTAPSMESAVIDKVPYDLQLEATERTGDWFRVIYLDYQGWLSAEYLATQGNCSL